MRLDGVLFAFFISKAILASPLAQQNQDSTDSVQEIEIQPDKITRQPDVNEAKGPTRASGSAQHRLDQELNDPFPKPYQVMRPGIAYDFTLSKKPQHLSEEENSGAPYNAYHRDSLQKRSKGKEPGGKPRNQTPGDDLDLETLRHKADQYHNNYLGSRNAEKRKTINAKDDSDPEKIKYKALKDAYNRYRRVSGVRNKYGPVERRADLAQYSSEDVQTLHQKYREFKKRYNGSTEGKAELARLKSRQGTVKELEEFDDLQFGHNEYRRWRSWDQAKTAGEYTPEERALLDTHREGHRRWRNEFEGPEKQEKRAKLEAGIGDPEELRRFQEARESYRAYIKTTGRHRRKYGKLEVEFDPSHREEIERLEDIRTRHNTYRKEYGGSKKAGIRANLEAGIGPETEVKRYQELREAYLEYYKIYRRTKSQILRGSGESDQDTPEDNEQEKITGTGRPRWFRPTYKKVGKIRKDKEHSDGTPNKAVLEQPAELTSSAGSQAPKDLPHWQKMTGTFVTYVKNAGTKMGTALNDAADTVLGGAISKPSPRPYKGPGGFAPPFSARICWIR